MRRLLIGESLEVLDFFVVNFKQFLKYFDLQTDVRKLRHNDLFGAYEASCLAMKVDFKFVKITQN